VAAALGWGALAASSLVIGGFLGLVRRWPERTVGLVLAFGAGALISAVSFDLAQEGARIGGPGTLAVGLGAGALTYYAAAAIVERRTNVPRRHLTGGPDPAPPKAAAGPALALGAFLDGIPEQLVLGIGLAAGEGVSVGLLAAIFISNLPEAVGSATEMRASGGRPGAIRRLWALIAVGCMLATPLGYAVADVTSGDLQAAINGFAAGALLVMLIDSMIPEAAAKASRPAGLATVLGFAVAAGLPGIA